MMCERYEFCVVEGEHAEHRQPIPDFDSRPFGASYKGCSWVWRDGQPPHGSGIAVADDGHIWGATVDAPGGFEEE